MLSEEQVASIQQLLSATGRWIQSQQTKVRGEDISDKSLNSFVTWVDQGAEEQLVNGLRKLLPRATFLTEEATVTQRSSALRWIIDPLDGTTNFLHGVPAYAISVALEVEGDLHAGFVYDIPGDRMYRAILERGAFCNDRPLAVSRSTSFSDTLLATGFPYREFDHLDTYLKVLRECMQSTRGLRRMGSAAIDLVMTAAGHFDGFFEYDLSPWDVAGGAVIVRESGGQVVDFSGGDAFIEKRELLAGNAIACQKLLEIIKKHSGNSSDT